MTDSLSIEAGVYGAELYAENLRLRAALRAVLAKPYGCPFCDSGKLRNPCKEHDVDCGFEMARIELDPNPSTDTQ